MTGIIVSVCVLVVTSVIAAVGSAVRQRLLAGKTEKELATIKQVVGIVVHAVEQTGEALNGKQKLHTAIQKATELLAKSSIEVSSSDIETVIEAAVKQMNEEYGESFVGK